MTALESLNQAVTDLQATVNSINVPADNSAAIQAAADSINASVSTLKNKLTPTV